MAVSSCSLLLIPTSLLSFFLSLFQEEEDDEDEDKDDDDFSLVLSFFLLFRFGLFLLLGRSQAPVGFDRFSYSYRDVEGTKFHQSIPQASSSNPTAQTREERTAGIAPAA